MTFDVNVNSVHRMARAFVPLLIESELADKSIVNLSSTAGTRVLQYFGGYSASKAAVDVITRQMALELGKFGIRVNCVTRTNRDGHGERHLPAHLRSVGHHDRTDQIGGGTGSPDVPQINEMRSASRGRCGAARTAVRPAPAAARPGRRHNCAASAPPASTRSGSGHPAPA